MNIVYLVLIDIVVIIHLTWVLFNLLGFLIVLKYPRMKLLHGSTLTITALLMITENVCPLTTLEQHLEQKTEITGTHHKSFLNRYLAQILYINVPPWAITTITISLTLTAILFYFVLPWIRRKNIIKPR